MGQLVKFPRPFLSSERSRYGDLQRTSINIIRDLSRDHTFSSNEYSDQLRRIVEASSKISSASVAETELHTPEVRYVSMVEVALILSQSKKELIDILKVIDEFL